MHGIFSRKLTKYNNTIKEVIIIMFIKIDFKIPKFLNLALEVKF